MKGANAQPLPILDPVDMKSEWGFNAVPQFKLHLVGNMHHLLELSGNFIFGDVTEMVLP